MRDKRNLDKRENRQNRVLLSLETKRRGGCVGGGGTISLPRDLVYIIIIIIIIIITIITIITIIIIIISFKQYSTLKIKIN